MKPIARYLARTPGLRQVGLLLMALLFAGCGALVTRHPVPLEDAGHALVLGRSDLRFSPDISATTTPDEALELLRQFDPARVSGGDSNFLALSGGGANGAFGAGLLAGWTKEGTRPDFVVVSGVSTGALSAPFAFLGADYDDVLAHVYTTTSTQDVLLVRKFRSLLRADSATDSAGLRDLVERHVDRPLLDKIAAAYAQGRRLFVATTDLDSGQPSIWDMGRIASLNGPEALALFRDVLIASASIPGAFSPVYISVEVDGRSYDEMHVDGGVSAQVFVLPAALPRAARSGGSAGRARHMWVIRNAKLTVEPKQVKPRIGAIAARSVDLLIRTQGIGDLYRIFAHAQRDDIDFNLAYIGDEFVEEPTEVFDPQYMQKLYDYGFDQAANGHPWNKFPPGYATNGSPR